MKKLSFIIFTILLIGQVSAQEIRVSTIFSISTYPQFNTNLGYGIGFNPVSESKNKFGFSFSQSFNYYDYSYEFFSDGEGKTQYRDVNPKNQRLTFSVNYGFNILKRQKYEFLVNPKIGLNYFKVNESIVYTYENETETHSFSQNYWKKNKIGLGCILEYQRKVFADKLFLSFSTEPELVFYSKFGEIGGSDPYFIGWICFNLNVKFNLAKNKTLESDK
jgi:hypothetical protein